MDREAGGNETQETGPEARAAGLTAKADTREGTPARRQPPPAEAPEQLPSGAQVPSDAQVRSDMQVMPGPQASALSEAQDQTHARAPQRAPAVTPDRAPPVTPDRVPSLTPDRAPAITPDRAPATRRDQARRRFIPAPQPNFPGLASDPRLPIWIGRGLAAIAVGVAVMIWQDWRFGLTAAAVVVIADIIYRSRTTSVIPASVRVTSAQRRTRRRLALLRAAGYVALNARAIPGRTRSAGIAGYRFAPPRRDGCTTARSGKRNAWSMRSGKQRRPASWWGPRSGLRSASGPRWRSTGRRSRGR
jgi:hypothetical protein